jgi:hypothetical protein
MRSIQDTAYPRLRSRVTALNLAHHYTPTADELALAKQSTRGLSARIGFLIGLPVESEREILIIENV